MKNRKQPVIYTKEQIIESYREGLVDGIAKGERTSTDMLGLYDRINIIRRILKEHGLILPNNNLSAKGESIPLVIAIYNAIDFEESDG